MFRKHFSLKSPFKDVFTLKKLFIVCLSYLPPRNAKILDFPWASASFKIFSTSILGKLFAATCNRVLQGNSFKTSSGK